jgi:hypothetical protein
LVFAGGCTITTKVRNIENAGGQLAIIGNAYNDNVEDVWMEDLDGSGFSLTIPAMLIQQEVALLLETALQNEITVKLKANFEIAHSGSSKADVSLWYGNVIDLPPTLIEDLYNYQHIWKNFAVFTPRILTIACPNCPKEVKEQNCFSDGLYCLIPPKQSLVKLYKDNATDNNLLLETLWGRCIYETYKESDTDALHYFNYLYDVMFSCLG